MLCFQWWVSLLFVTRLMSDVHLHMDLDMNNGMETDMDMDMNMDKT